MKVCLNCGKPLVRKKWDSQDRWERKKFCNPACMREFLKKQKEKRKTQKKRCKICGNIFYNEKGLSPAVWERKTTCSKNCMLIARGKVYRYDKVKKEGIEKKIESLFKEAKVWVNGKLVKDNGWRDEEWWREKIERAKKDLKRGKVIYGCYK